MAETPEQPGEKVIDTRDRYLNDPIFHVRITATAKAGRACALVGAEAGHRPHDAGGRDNGRETVPDSAPHPRVWSRCAAVACGAGMGER